MRYYNEIQNATIKDISFCTNNVGTTTYIHMKSQTEGLRIKDYKYDAFKHNFVLKSWIKSCLNLYVLHNVKYVVDVG